MNEQRINPYVAPGISATVDDITTDDIISKVCAFFQVERNAIFMKNRREAVRHARQVVIWMLRRKRMMYSTHIAQYFGMNHTTILHSVQVIDDEIATDDSFSQDIKRLVVSVTGLVGNKEAEELKKHPLVIKKSNSRPAAEYSNRSPYGIAKH